MCVVVGSGWVVGTSPLLTCMCICTATGVSDPCGSLWSASSHIQSEETRFDVSDSVGTSRGLVCNTGIGLTGRMTILADDDVGIVVRPAARPPHIAQPAAHLPVRPRLRYVRNAHRVRSGEELQIGGLLARPLSLVDRYVVVAAGFDVRSDGPVGRADVVA